MNTYRIDLDRLNRHQVITYFHYVNFKDGYAPLASAALALRWIGVPHLMPHWMMNKLRTAGLLSSDGDLTFTVPAEKRASPYGQTFGFPLWGDEQPNIVTVNLASLDTPSALAVFKSPVTQGSKRDHMTALRTILDIFGLRFPAWAVRRGAINAGFFTGMFPAATTMEDVEAEEFCDMIGVDVIDARSALAALRG